MVINSPWAKLIEPHHPENQPDAKRGQRVQAAHAQRIDNGLDQALHHKRLAASSVICTPKYAASKRGSLLIAAASPLRPNSPPLIT